MFKPAAAPDKQNRADDDPWHQREPDLPSAWLCRWCCRRLRHRSGGIVAGPQSRRGPYLLGMPHPHEKDQAGHGDKGGADVDDPGIDEVRDEELRDCKGYTADKDCGPNLDHAPEARENPDQPKWHDEGENGEQAPNHRTQQVGIEACDARKALNWRA